MKLCNIFVEHNLLLQYYTHVSRPCVRNKHNNVKVDYKFSNNNLIKREPQAQSVPPQAQTPLPPPAAQPPSAVPGPASPVATNPATNVVPPPAVTNPAPVPSAPKTVVVAPNNPSKPSDQVIVPAATPQIPTLLPYGAGAEKLQSEKGNVGM
ncbi:15336_t:CDS:2, partial [Cetraspora pellucida]